MILRHDCSDRESLVNEKQWPALTSFFRGHGGASLVAPTWLLTAAHVADDLPTEVRLSVEFAGKRYRLARTISHPAYDRRWRSGDQNDGANTVDLALVELEEPVEDIPPYDLYDGSDEQGQEVRMLGGGEFGNGIRGARGTDRALRQATNRVDEVDEYWLKMRFDAPPDGTALEGVCGRGDSGGPAFIRKGNRFLLAGISSWQHTGNGPLGLYGCVEHYTRVSRFVEWIRVTCGLKEAPVR